MPESISIVIPCYNQGEYLREALASIDASHYQPSEILVVDDGSDDPLTREILTTLDHPLTRVIHQPNQGLSSARNSGIAAAHGRYILPLDADDRIGPDYLGEAVSLLAGDRQVGIVYCRGALFGAQNGVIKAPEYTPFAMRLSNLIFSCALFRKEDWQAVGGYSQELIYGCEDWDFWIGLLERGLRPVRLSQVGFYYRIRQGSMNQEMDLTRRKMMHHLIIKRHPRFFPWGFRLVLPLYYALLGGFVHRLVRSRRGRG